MRGTFVARGIIVLGLVSPLVVHAHAFLQHAEPRVGSTVSAPAAVTLFFTEPVEEAFSRIEVRDEHGATVPTGALQHPAPDRLTVSLPSLRPGTYTVHWAVVSVDTHPTEGSFEVSVKEP
jgi:methionine-rich copper-binding protein CopC